MIRDHRALSRRAFRSGADLLVLLDFCSSDHRLKPVPLEKRRKAGPSAGLGMTLFFVSDVAARLKPCPDENQMQSLPASKSGRYKGRCGEAKRQRRPGFVLAGAGFVLTGLLVAIIDLS